MSMFDALVDEDDRGGDLLPSCHSKKHAPDGVTLVIAPNGVGTYRCLKCRREGRPFLTTRPSDTLR